MLPKYPNLALNQRWLIALLCLLGAALVWGAIQIRNATQPIEKIGPGVQYFADVKNEHQIEQILTLGDENWQVETRNQLSFGMADHPYWFKFDLDVPADKPALLEIDYALLDKVDLWFFHQGRLISEHHEGDTYSFGKRKISHEKVLIDVPLGFPSFQVVVKARTQGTLRLPVNLWELDTFMVYNGEHSLVLGLFFGFMAAMALSNLFFFVTTKSPTFLSYCGYVLFLAFTLASLHGITFKYFWPDNLWLQSRSIAICATTTILFALVFSMQLLDVKAHSRVLYQALRGTAAIFLVGLLVSLILPYSIYIQIYMVMMVLAVLVIYSTGLLLWYRGVKLALFYTIAWTVLLVSAFVTSLDNWNLIHLETPPHYMLMFGATVETFLLALVLAISYTRQRQEQFESQALALAQERHSRQAKEEILKVQEEAQEELEYKVQERTLELEIALRELSETNRELEKKNTTDSLTGIRNRDYFDKKYQAEVRRSRREQTELSVVMLDIDHFKQINDQYGHLAGDECIRFVASILKQNLRRPSDDACRYGGEEFAIILPNTNQQGAHQVVESMRVQLESAEISTPAGLVKLTVSAGICTAVVRSVEDESELLKCADEALYRAKNHGRNRVEQSELQPVVAVNQD